MNWCTAELCVTKFLIFVNPLIRLVTGNISNFTNPLIRYAAGKRSLCVSALIHYVITHSVDGKPHDKDFSRSKRGCWDVWCSERELKLNSGK